MQGVKEDLSMSKAENCFLNADEVYVILSEVGVNATVKQFKRLGKLKNGRARPRTLLVNLRSKHEVRMVPARAGEKRELYSQRGLFLLPGRTKDDALGENLVLEK